MLETTTPNHRDAHRIPSHRRPEPVGSKDDQTRRRKPSRIMRARRTAAIMVAFGIVLGCVELIIVLSYL